MPAIEQGSKLQGINQSESPEQTNAEPCALRLFEQRGDRHKETKQESPFRLTLLHHANCRIESQARPQRAIPIVENKEPIRQRG